MADTTPMLLVDLSSTTDEIYVLTDYRQLCIDMLEAWDIASCPVLPSDPDVVFERARKLLGRDVWPSIDTYSEDDTEAKSFQYLK